MRHPDVTIIVLTYNQENTLSRAIDSILKQDTSFNYEILIGEDASMDKTREIAYSYQKEYPDIIKIMPPAPNKGIYRNSLECIKACNTNFVAFCSGDDYYCNDNKLQYQVEFLMQNPKCVAVHSEMKHVNYRTGHISSPPFRKNVPSGNISNTVFFEHIVYTPTLMFKRESLSNDIIDKLLMQSFRVDDIVFLSYMAQQGEIHYIKKYDVAYNTGAETVCQSMDLRKRVNFINHCYDALFYVYDDIRPDFPKKILYKLREYDLCKAILSDRKLIELFKYRNNMTLSALFASLSDIIRHNKMNRQRYYKKFV